jgi:hypothetical protein
MASIVMHISDAFLPLRISKLLDRLDGEGMQLGLPTHGLSPVPVRASNIDRALSGEFIEDATDGVWPCVLAVDQQGNAHIERPAFSVRVEPPIHISPERR